MRTLASLASLSLLLLHPADALHSGPLPATCSGWLAFLEEVRQQVGQLVLLTCPTERFRTPDKQAGRAVVARRNEIVRQLVNESWSGSASSSSGGSDGDSGGGGDSGGKGSSRPADNATGSSSGGSGGPRPLLLLDLDALTKERLPPDVTISQQDYHYQCYPSTTSGFASELAPVVGSQAGIAPCLLPACHRSVHAIDTASSVCADAPECYGRSSLHQMPPSALHALAMPCRRLAGVGRR